MRLTRCHVDLPLEAGGEIVLPEETANHLLRVLRLAEGDDCVLFNGDGRDYPATITLAAKREARVRLGTPQAVDRESPRAIVLLQGIARGEKMDLILQKATELGVARIVPLITGRTEVRLDAERAERRLAHWHAVVASACEQCGRNRLPQLARPVRLADWAASVAGGEDVRLVLDPAGDITARTLPATRVATRASRSSTWASTSVRSSRRS